MTDDHIQAVLGLTEADFNSWKPHPATKAFRQYLTDFAAAIERDHLMRWRAGEMDDRTEHEGMGRVKVLEEMATLEFSHIAVFYEEPKQEEPNEVTDLQNPFGEI